MDNNWKVEFQTAAGDRVFDAEGYKNPVTMDLVTEDTFVFQGLVQMAHADHETQSMGCDVIPLSETWEKAVVNSDIFGLSNVEVSKQDISEETRIAAHNEAYMSRRDQGPDIAGDVFG